MDAVAEGIIALSPGSSASRSFRRCSLKPATVRDQNAFAPISKALGKRPFAVWPRQVTSKAERKFPTPVSGGAGRGDRGRDGCGCRCANRACLQATSQLVCASRPGERQTYAADTSAGVTLVTVLGAAVCEKGKTWDYDAAGIWVSDGCSAVFAAAPPKASRGSFGPAGFKLADTGTAT